MNPLGGTTNLGIFEGTVHRAASHLFLQVSLEPTYFVIEQYDDTF